MWPWYTRRKPKRASTKCPGCRTDRTPETCVEKGCSLVMCRPCFEMEGWAPCRYCNGATCGEHGIVCEPCERRACNTCYSTAKWEFCNICEYSTCPDCIKDGLCAQCADRV